MKPPPRKQLALGPLDLGHHTPRRVLTVVAGLTILQQLVSHRRQSQAVIELAIGEQSGIRCDPRTAKRELQAAAEVGALPIYPELTDEQQKTVVHALAELYRR
jgi:hypothetical protein